MTVSNPLRQWKDAHTCMYINMCTRVCAHIHMYVHMCTCTPPHTHTHLTEQWFLKCLMACCSPQKSLDVEFQLYPRPTESSTLGMGLDSLYVTSSPGLLQLRATVSRSRSYYIQSVGLKNKRFIQIMEYHSVIKRKQLSSMKSMEES